MCINNIIFSNMPITRVDQTIYDTVLLNKNRQEYSQVFSSDRRKFKLLSLDRRIGRVSIRVLCSDYIFCAPLPKRVTFPHT